MMYPTSKLYNIDPKLVALFKDAFAALGDEVVKSFRETSHLPAEVLKAEVDTGE